MPAPNRVTYIGLAHSRRGAVRFGIRETDRLAHIYIIGKTGTGKSTLLLSMAAQDLASGQGVFLLDPHGDLAEALYGLALRSGRTDVRYWNVPDPDSGFGYNPLRHVRADKIPLAVSGLLDAFKKYWSDAWGVRMEHVLRNALYALIEQRGSVLSDILRLLSEKEYRRSCALHLTNEPVKTFWLREFPAYSDRYRIDSIAPIQNKVGAFLADPVLNRILTKPADDIHLRRLMDEGGVLILNLAKGRIGEDSANLLGSLMIATLNVAAFSRADIGSGERRPFYVYIDEFHSFTTSSIASMASELRKYGVGMALANQHLHQLDPDIRHGVLGNAGTLISFRVGTEDAVILSREFMPVFQAGDLLTLPNHWIYLKLLVDGMPTAPFSATTLPSPTLP
ncbi:MAG: type IV secretion system DNA-binding domain-containing protein [Alphaproteobacteria bacterium]|nr:type IV secretion system DNA-binding domain-containing protein [Alphaproteobacteria bacterium]